MKRRLYTEWRDIDFLKEMDNHGKIITSDEHAYITEKAFGHFFKSKEALLHYYLTLNAKDKLAALGFFIDYINTNGLTNVLLLGAGQCVLEYLLSLSLPENANVIATDYDMFFINKAKELFPNITSIKFDLVKDDIKQLRESIGINIDIAVFFGSAYVMDDLELIKLLSDLKEIRVKRVIDFHGGYIDWRTFGLNILEPVRKSTIIRRLLRKPPLKKDDYLGKFHGYGRSRGELRKIYKLAGLRLTKETSIGGYKYIAICNC